MIVSGKNKDEISKALTRELPFGLWCVNVDTHRITGYNKFSEMLDVSADIMSVDEFLALIRDDYRTMVSMCIDDLPHKGELDVTFPTNHRWLRAKVTYWDISNRMAYGYLVECGFDNDPSKDSEKSFDIVEKQNQMIQRFFDKLEDHRLEKATDSILRDVQASTGCDRVSVFEYDIALMTQTCTHEVKVFNAESRVEIINNVSCDVTSWLTKLVSKGDVQYVNDLSGMSAEIVDQLKLLGCNGVKSMAIVPLFRGEIVIGYMLLDYISRGRQPRPSERVWLRSLGKIVEYSLSITNRERKHLTEKDQLNSIIGNIPFGFVQFRFIYNSERRPSDLLIVNTNNTFETEVGIRNISGKLVSEVFGKELSHMLSVCMSVATVGEKKLVEDFLYANGQVFCADVFMSGYNELQCITSTNIQYLFPSLRTSHKDPTEAMLMSRELQHTLRTRLNAILGFAELMLGEEEQQNKYKYMEIIKENAQSLLDSTFIRKSISETEEQKNPEATSTAAQSAAEVAKKKILVAEDTESNYMLVSYILKNDYDLFWAHDGVEALEMYESVKPDLILMDVRMPRLDGMTATSRIRETDKVTPIIALTAFAFESDKAKTLESGCSDFVSKPINARALKDIVKKYLSGV